MDINDPKNQETLNSLLLAHGVAANFIDFAGQVVNIPLENRLRVLAEMGIELPAGDDVGACVDDLFRNRHGRLVPPVLVLTPGCDRIPLQNTGHEQGVEISWHISGEDGDLASGVFVTVPEAECHGQSIAVPPLARGYYRLALNAGRITTDAFVIVAPDRAYQPEFLGQGRRLWGISAQLFTLTSERNWGIGDFSDLIELVELAAARGADFILLNPLHALDIREPENASPYSPVDRRFLNPLYIDPAMTAEYHHRSFQAWLDNPDITSTADHLRQSANVLYADVLSFKYTAFSHLFLAFQDTCRQQDSEREAAFQAFVRQQGPSLQRFADFQAGRHIADIPAAKDPAFHMYLQWLAETQLKAAQERARLQGMEIGLIRDLAVGATDDSFEVLDHPGLFCRHARIGAPPDHFNPQGQNWGLTPTAPMAMEQSGFEHFIELLRANMRSCGALRLDHILSLMRLWWCPVDGPNGAGAYVHYNTEALFAILRLESQRTHCMIIGEDLGVVPPEIRAYISGSAILSNTIFYFEKYDGISFRKPEHYNPGALAIITNHDVPTLKAWWNTSDLALRRKIGLIEDDESLHRENEARERDKHCLLTMLDDIHLLPEQWLDRDVHKPFDLNLCMAIIRACARSVSSLVSMQLDDLAGLETPINIPGTNREYANWRRKLPLPTRELFARDDVGAMLAPLREERP